MYLGFGLRAKDYLIAVYDVGKTNKKFMLFNSELKPVYKATKRIDEISKNGMLYDDADSIIRWMKEALAEAPERDKIKAIAITTFGATGALLDSRGELVIPVISYNNEIPREIRDDFYATFGSPEELYVRTGTPPYGQLLNFGIQLFWIKRTMPRKYEETKTILFLPQYLSYVLTGSKAIEITSVGCHTYLYDIVKRGWSSVAEGLEVPEKAPGEFTEVWESIGEAKWLEGALVTTGIHDSNASLVPFLIAGWKQKFVLASTGTWCVFMYPGAEFRPRREDVYRDVLYYIDAFSRPVRSARFKGGYEFEYYADLISRMFQVPASSFLDMDVNEKTFEELLRAKRLFVIPTLTPGSGQFPRSKGRIVGREEFSKDLKIAYHALNASMAVQTYFALKAMLEEERGLKVTVVGGFSKNPMYLKMLATMLRSLGIKVFKTEYEDLTSLGTAVTAKIAYEGIAPGEVDREVIDKALKEIEIKPLEGIDEGMVTEYIDKFEELCLSSA